MAKMIIMRGLPGSGKSTLAKKMMEESGNLVRINKDLLRTMLHFDKFNFKNEDITREAAFILADTFLRDGKSVIIDDTNLNPKTAKSWADLALNCEAKVEYVDVDTPYDECISRDALREKPVGEAVIFKMALQHGLTPPVEKGYVICDLDGTLCNIEHRLHFLKSKKPNGDEYKDWRGFFGAIVGDELRTEVLDMLKAYKAEGYNIVFVSARPDTYRGETQRWFTMQGIDLHDGLLMRPESDGRVDVEVKQDIYDKYFKDKKVHKVIDDRPSVIRMWRENDLDVIDVGKGEEF